MEFVGLAIPPMTIAMVLARNRLWPNVASRSARIIAILATAVGGIAAVWATPGGRGVIGTAVRTVVMGSAGFLWIFLPTMWISDEVTKRRGPH